MKEYLPIGTVVTLVGGVKKLMITGIMTALRDAPETVYDYIGVMYPEGFIGEPGNFLFNEEDINDIVFKGYSNQERELFLERLDKSLQEIAEEDDTPSVTGDEVSEDDAPVSEEGSEN